MIRIVVVLIFTFSCLICSSLTTDDVIDASCIKGYRYNKSLDVKLPDSVYETLQDKYIGKLFIQAHDEPIPYLFKLADCSKYKINKNDTLQCVAIKRVINYPLLASKPPIALVFKSPEGEICWTILEHSQVHIKNLEEKLAKEAQDRETFITREKAMIRKYGTRIGKLIAKNRVAIGFTKEMCIDSWGKPKYRHTTTTRYGVSEQWVYSGGFLYFENGKLTAIQK